MYTMYPAIKSIDDLLPHILGNENFSVNRKESDGHGYIVVDYILNTPELFKNEWEKECRGIIFDEQTGVVISRPYHKFFNLNEREESTYKYGIFGNPVVLEKLDGSMIRAFKVGDRWIWGSKAGETFLTPQIEVFVKDHPQYQEIVSMETMKDYTMIWEWCSRKNRIVVDHPKDRLVLTAIRHNVTGEYTSFETMHVIGDMFNVEVVAQLSLAYIEVESITTENFEGIVLRFDSGHMVKVKTEKYLRYHRAKDAINREKNVIAILVNNEADDFRILLSPDDRERFEKFENDFFVYVGNISSSVYQLIKSMMYDKLTKKNFALNHQNYVKPLTRRIFFKYLEGDHMPSFAEVYEDIINILRGKVNNQASVDEARQLFHVNWNDYNSGVNEEWLDKAPLKS
jgi:RNA ligase